MANPSIHYQLEVPPAPCLLCADEKQLSQVLTNLLKNAAEGIEARGETDIPGRISLTLACHDNHFEITIEDNGIGISRRL